MSGLPDHVEIGPRLYAVAVVPDAEWDAPGKRCVADHREQVIRIAASASRADRVDLLERAVAESLCLIAPGWRHVPLAGKAT